MKTTHLRLNERTLCHRVMDRFAWSEPTAEDAPIDCRTCRLAHHLPANRAATPVRVETCDACGTGRVTTHETYDLPNRMHPDRMVRWSAWTACDQHGHDVFDMARFRLLLAATVDGLTDDEYRAATGEGVTA